MADVAFTLQELVNEQATAGGILGTKELPGFLCGGDTPKDVQVDPAEELPVRCGWVGVEVT